MPTEQALVDNHAYQKICAQCVAECSENGGACAPLTQEERLGWEHDGMDYRKMLRDHRRQHIAVIRDAVVICPRGHRSEADPVEAMRAAKVPTLFEAMGV